MESATRIWKATKPIRADIVVFCESTESRKWPAFAFCLGNGAECYSIMDGIWNESIFSEDPLGKYNASM